MLQSNQEMLNLVNAVLEVYRYESGQLVLCKDNFVLKDLLSNAQKKFTVLIENKNLKLNIINISDEKIYADKHEIKRVIANFTRKCNKI